MNPLSSPSRHPFPRSHPAASLAPTRSEALLLWIGLAFAFSPTVFDLAEHLIEEPWARYALVFPVLFVRCVLREERSRAVPAGVVWIIAGLGIELAAAFAGGIRWARPGLALAVFGLSQRLGLASWRTAALIFFAIPIPAFVVDLVYPNQEWLALAPLLAGLGWYDGVLLQRPLRRTLVTSASLAALAVPIEVLARGLVVAAAALGWGGQTQALVSHGSWIAVAAAGIVLSEARLRRRAR